MLSATLCKEEVLLEDKFSSQKGQPSLDNYLLFEQPSSRLLTGSGIKNFSLGVWHFVFTLWGTSERGQMWAELLNMLKELLINTQPVF